jgi:hypothetical protein
MVPTSVPRRAGFVRLRTTKKHFTATPFFATLFLPAWEKQGCKKGRVAKRASKKDNESVSPKGLADSLFCVKIEL